MVAALLRTDIGEVFLAHLVLVVAQELAVLAVAVVLNGAASIVSQLAILLRHLQLHAVAEHRWYLGSFGYVQLLTNDDLALLSQRVGHHELSFHVGHIELCNNTIAAYRTAGKLHLRLTPHAEALLQPSTVVVIRGGTPELWCHALTIHEHRLAVNVQIVNPAAPLTYGHRGAAAGQLDVTGGLLYIINSTRSV